MGFIGLITYCFHSNLQSNQGAWQDGQLHIPGVEVEIKRKDFSYFGPTTYNDTLCSLNTLKVKGFKIKAFRKYRFLYHFVVSMCKAIIFNFVNRNFFLVITKYNQYYLDLRCTQTYFKTANNHLQLKKFFFYLQLTNTIHKLIAFY